MTTKKSITQKRPEYKSPLKPASEKSSTLSSILFRGTTTERISCTDSNLGNKPKPAHFDSVRYNDVQNSTSVILSVGELKKCVAALNETSQQELLDFLLLQKMNRKQTSDQDRKLAMLMDSLTTELGKLLGNSNRVFPLPQLPDVRKMFRQVEALMLDLKMSECNIQDTKAFYNVIARVLILHANAVSTSAKIPVTMKLVLQTNTTLHALLDNNFPNYMAAGLMKAVLNASRNGIVNDGEYEDAN
jgi:hypothetical protein